jgi:hypothetical protein
MHVLYSASSPRYEAAYAEVFEEFDRQECWVVEQRERDFNSDLFQLMPMEGHVVFFVDDQIFTRHWDMRSAITGLSLRLGKHLTKCYPTCSAQAVPRFISVDNPHGEQLYEWRGIDGEGDWRYPLSLDGNVYNAEELGAMLRQLSFDSPNRMESELQRFSDNFLSRQRYCFAESRVVNVPWNRVQNTFQNRCATEQGVSSEEMLVHWETGHQIAIQNLADVRNESCHQEFPLILELR